MYARHHVASYKMVANFCCGAHFIFLLFCLSAEMSSFFHHHDLRNELVG